MPGTLIDIHSFRSQFTFAIVVTVHFVLEKSVALDRHTPLGYNLASHDKAELRPAPGLFRAL